MSGHRVRASVPQGIVLGLIMCFSLYCSKCHQLLSRLKTALSVSTRKNNIVIKLLLNSSYFLEPLILGVRSYKLHLYLRRTKTQGPEYCKQFSCNPSWKYVPLTRMSNILQWAEQLNGTHCQEGEMNNNKDSLAHHRDVATPSEHQERDWERRGERKTKREEC